MTTTLCKLKNVLIFVVAAMAGQGTHAQTIEDETLAKHESRLGDVVVTPSDSEITLHDAIKQAALNNPGVLAAWEAFIAAHHGHRVAKGAYYPDVDFIAEVGQERSNDPLNETDNYDISSVRLTLTQMIFDGFATKYEVAKQNYFQLTRYYEFKLAAEELGLETATAYVDVLRYQKLVQLAKENYIQHRLFHRDIQERVESGVGRGVDLQQASARLSLAESNLLTEATNLHDVKVRYQRLVGEEPYAKFTEPSLASELIPDTKLKALEIAFEANPQLNAAIESIRATRADFRGATAPMMPRLDLRIRHQDDDNTRDINGRYEESAIELVMTYNLYNGGSDKARKKQAYHLMHEARDTRERVCREVRQTLLIAYNDIKSTSQMVKFMDDNQKAIGRAREAYRNQFDIGQRTLLDLLDTENEYFEVRRTLVNAEYDVILAKARTLASMGKLLQAFSVEGHGDVLMQEKLNFDREASLSGGCPIEAPREWEIDKESLFADLPELAKVSKSSAPQQVLQLNVEFASQSAVLSGNDDIDVRNAADYLCKNPNAQAVVAGHTDSQGSEISNLKLSQARAESVLKRLVAYCPSSEIRLKAVGYGELRPIGENTTAEGRRRNRRVELVIQGAEGQLN